MKTFPVLTVFVFITLQETFAQISEDFSDGNLDTNPGWLGTIDHFVINDDYELQLNASTAGTSWLATDFYFNAAGETVWEFLIRQTFSPSGANFGRFYLVSDHAYLTGDLNGYFLQFGEAGSNDAIELFRQTGSEYQSVCRAATSGISTAFKARVKVKRTNQGRWELSIDYNGNADFILEASGTDETYTEPAAFCGVLFAYTITNATRFFVDDVAVKTFEAPDQSTPKAVALEITSSQSLTVSFSEALDESTGISQNYYVSPRPGQPLSATPDTDHPLVKLTFSEPFVNGAESVLRIENISDRAGNIMEPTEMKFRYFAEEPVLFRDIVFTELFADPGPPRALPAAEFVELFNRSSNPVDISGWQLADETTSGEIPQYILLPNKFLILTSPGAAEMFQSYGDVLAITRFPSLNNSGDVIVLKNDHGATIDSLKYSTLWYGDGEKAEGGWSLELIDPHNICLDSENWISSEAPEGGTPGTQNSVYASRPDNIGPIPTTLAPDSLSLAIVFNEKLNASIPSLAEFAIVPPLGIVSLEFSDPGRRTLVMTLSEPPRQGQTYTVALGDIYDCPGNRIQHDHSTVTFVLPQHAEPGDIVLNEILFNPRPTGVDFIEVYNRSAKVIDLKDWSVRNFTGTESSWVESDANLLIRPGEFLVFSGNGNTLKGEYIMGRQETFFDMDLPALNDDEGSVALVDQKGLPIDSIFYTDDMHSPFIRDREGVSLERITFSPSATGIFNWRSASSTAGFATPGYANSNARGELAMGEGSVTVFPEIIRSDRTRPGFAQISYHFGSGGMSANVMVFDHQGRPIKSIAENELLGAEGFFRWDGDRDSGGFATTGYYLVWFEVFDASGAVRTFRKRVAVF